MTDQAQTADDVAAAEEPGRAWRPSGRPTHRKDAASETGRIIQKDPTRGVVGGFTRYLRRPFVRLVIGLGLFILAAIVYDSTINFGEWTERKARPEATKHKGIAPVEKTPDQ